MKTFTGLRTVAEMRNECSKHGAVLDDSALSRGSDCLMITFAVGGTSGRAFVSSVNGRFFGTLENGERFDSNLSKDEDKPWFNALLDMVLSSDDQGASSTQPAAAASQSRP